jgi:radical SAM protein with 4Fe4S-binding SPASM domain
LGISLDGWREIHDKNRFYYEKGLKRGSFNKIMRNLEKIREKEIPISISTTISDNNISLTPSIVNFLSEEGFDNIGLNPPINPNNKREDFARLIAIQIVNSYELLRNKGIYEDRVGRRMKRLLLKKPYYRECSAYGRQMVVSPDGLVNNCHAFYKMNVFTPWVALEEYNQKNNKKWKNLLTIRTENCKYCPFINICGMGCMYRAYHYNHNPKSIDKLGCILTKKIIDWMAFELIKDIKCMAIDIKTLFHLKNKKIIINKELVEKLRRINIKKVFFGAPKCFNQIERVRSLSIIEENKTIEKSQPEEICKETNFKKHEIVFVVKEPQKLLRYDKKGYKTYLVDSKSYWLEDIIRIRKSEF